jgi:hypothetical protein
VSLKSEKNNWYFIRKYYLAEFFIQYEMFQTKVVEKVKTHALHSVTFSSENRAVYEVMWKNTVESDRSQGGNIIRRRKDATFMPDN